MDFTNKNVLITGGTTGIGLATAKEFIKAGANVWITGRNSENLEKAANEINSQKLKTIVSDTANLSDLSLLEKAFAENNAPLDVLFLNAGIARFTSIEDVTEADFDAQFNTNVKGHFFTLQKLLPHLAEGSSVIFTSSTVATASNLGSSIYSATKGALNKIAQIAANELAGRKIRVNIVSPGPVSTPGLHNAVPEEAKEYLAGATAMQRLGDSSEIAKTVLFLASENASFITGTELLADGGYINYALK
ncbi:SDR family oxidoreductase [Flavobacterium johnsoniae]|uniref:Short-chain dehydrogenase/reductase SDR n=1 Tax=Flavobacterium johnsoniae (strain ATCC 17061 / DSM 2064 / JCM 8514 / BCRC 14874 / CCUG 350202 / NBRC 14942 / NCIMB 11054 / UW101) TaxID=376686 RepID=A5FD58_FLAJ1|nr:SDR family oxidoreductase [Flavobacterium johnsoniae]ABQ06858.1 short-chain dehydrogenase/reductase SDR [Flavobacterium johnsoniae UW101]OXE97282.1 short-chain dehydrogenase [Flavobacterium johnsoniae UW101]WQG81308.1 SDR family oxidoreductase [Flavobacterium johnsoniae UW101]SHL38541.1 NAD(P)-dependent dehydrogenase, short-chain alcohol dehydrogenase family [Flavobacterium johnsoniae]